MASRFLNKNTKGPKGDLGKIFLMSKELVGVGSRSGMPSPKFKAENPARKTGQKQKLF